MFPPKEFHDLKNTEVCVCVLEMDLDANDNTFQSFMSMCVSPTPIFPATEEVDNGMKCTSRLAQLYNNSKFCDVVLVVGNDRFYAHKLLLATASDVFEQMLTNVSWQDSEKKELILEEQEDCSAVFGKFLKYIYSGQILLCTDMVLGLLVLADKYNVPDLKECCSDYMSRHLVSSPEDNKAVLWYQYAIACSSLNLQAACFNYIVLNMDIVVPSPDWIYLAKENLKVLLDRSDLVVYSEYTLLQAVVRWLTDETRVSELKTNLKDILPFIRFPMILPECLAEFESSAFQKENHADFAPYLLAAYRYHALSVRGGGGGDICRSCEVPGSQYLYRNYTDSSYSIHVDVIRKGYRSCPRVSSKVEKSLSLPQNLCNIVTERQCKMKITFYPHGYYTTSLWNGQLNLAKSTDLTKIVVAHRGGIELRDAEISIVVFAQHNGVRYADFAISKKHVFETYGTFEIENTVNIEKVREEGSPYIIDSMLFLKVFVRPVNL